MANISVQIRKLNQLGITEKKPELTNEIRLYAFALQLCIAGRVKANTSIIIPTMLQINLDIIIQVIFPQIT